MVGWPELAACQDSDPDLFYPVGTSELAENQVATAKAVCARCPVRAPCLQWALHVEGHGVWGGTTPEERRVLRSNALAEKSG